VTLDPERLARYARQLVIPVIGPAGQERLGEARVRVVGAGAGAAPGILYLLLAGVGTLWIDDPEQVNPGDAGQWLFPPATVGRPRAEAVAEALQPRSRFVGVEPWRAEHVPTAAAIFASSTAQAVAAAEEARKAGIPHVVAESDGDGGTVVTVPSGAPCYSCARSIGSAGRPPSAAGAALSALAAEELILLLADPGTPRARRTDLTRGVPSTRATARLAGCVCGSDIAR
jgi:molybdopterin/thiamine biosynthesis adenylyltransferase